MKRSGSRKKNRRGARARRRPAAESSRELICVDNAPIRRKALSGCRRTLGSLDRAREEWEAYQKEIYPEFERWYNTRFGERLTRFRELEERLAGYSDLFELADYLRETEGLDEGAAYAKACDIRENPEKYAAAYGYERDDEEDSFEPEDEGGQEPEIEEEMARMMFRMALQMDLDPDAEEILRDPELFEEAFADFMASREAGETTQDGFIREYAPGNEADDTEILRIKTLYRRLALTLHPDRGANEDPRKMELWFEIQEAYRENDLERMEILAALAAIHAGRQEEDISVGQMVQVQDEYRRQTRALRATINREKKNLPWYFHRSRNKKALARKIASEMDEDLEGLKRRVEYFERIFRQWSEQATRTPAARKKRPANEERREPREKKGGRRAGGKSADSAAGRQGAFDF